jgi:hypothetical protein
MAHKADDPFGRCNGTFVEADGRAGPADRGRLPNGYSLVQARDCSGEQYEVRDAYKARDHACAQRILKHLAARGDREAMFRLSVLYPSLKP